MRRRVAEIVVGTRSIGLIANDGMPVSDATDALVTGPPRSGETTGLESATPVLAAIEADATDGGIGAAKNRPDMELFVVGPDARDALPETPAARVRSRIRPR